MEVIKRNGRAEAFDQSKIDNCIEWACRNLNVSPEKIKSKTKIQLMSGVKTSEIHLAVTRATAELIDIETPDYEYAAARLLLQQIFKEVCRQTEYPNLQQYITLGVNQNRLDPKMLNHFDLERLNAAIDAKRDFKFKYLGLKTLYDRYLIRETIVNRKIGKVIEMPQHFWMRVAMGIALNESKDQATDWAIKFYNVLSNFEFVNSTPTLFNAGTLHSQLSSCYVVTVDDSIFEPEGTNLGKGIFSSITECALYSKFAGGIGADWTRVRPSGGKIESTNGVSSGVIPYLKVFNDVGIGVNQGGKRAASFAVYLEPWHGDIERFLDLKKPKGDERLRARELFPALWTNDLFMERVRNNEQWSLFCSHQHPELHELYGDAFKQAYEAAEKAGDALKVVSAKELWRKIITALVESGAPWITFKDEMNRRNPQDHDGVIHSSNLCVEISLNNNDLESAVCNLGSINLSRVNPEQFKDIVPIAIRMLDNVIDLNFYPTDKARNSNMRHRPIGLGVMGWSELLAQKGIDFESNEHLVIADDIFERLSYWSIRSSMNLAIEKGKYQSYEGSKWSKGIFPIDTARQLPFEWANKESSVEWGPLREAVKKNGIRNCNLLAIAPTATLGLIVGTTPCIEPVFKISYTEENKAGKFKVIDPSIKYHNDISKVKTAFDIDQKWVIKAAAVRQKWICQSQSVNIFKRQQMKGNELSELYFLAWELGLKATYYLKQQIASHDHEEIGSVEKSEEVVLCSIDNPGCESCQ